ncbi:hypothetical protein I7I53_10624 [Histoplasma capsulatum var. duboisii H88]|uniref:Uncharacterized protein n=1 Tax=Ajellomyces capsulatus (strain H88) TaxID=544711 RepID=A0A8A1LE46_AJEC8|nr:hypothetical protein I7I53_10624 [Histoplasma capsulatum var. duboisii H88]
MSTNIQFTRLLHLSGPNVLSPGLSDLNHVTSRNTCRCIISKQRMRNLEKAGIGLDFSPSQPIITTEKSQETSSMLPMRSGRAACQHERTLEIPS